MWGVKLVTLLLFIKVVTSNNPCDQQYDAGPCRGAKHVVAFENGQCASKLYGGCKGNDNRFESIEACESTCARKLTKKFSPTNPICLKPAVDSSQNKCRGLFPRFYFNSDEGKCQKMVYGGCGATENNFITLEDCVGVCMTETEARTNFVETDDYEYDPSSNEEEVDMCDLPPIAQGVLLQCMAFIKKWTFSKSEGRCVPYIYGGCHGTRNLFDSEVECNAICPGSRFKPLTAEVCHLPIQPGPCIEDKQMFGFNAEAGRCEVFKYGGCMGNDNRFATVEECVNTCGGLSEPVVAPLVNSNCDNVIVQCDHTEAIVKKSQGCVPITKPGECCPSSWDCSAWQTRLANKDKCFHDGKLYNSGEAIEGVQNTCQVGCMCTTDTNGHGVIRCAHVDCAPPPPEFTWDSCRPRYTGDDTCCASEYTCGADLETLATCQLEGKTYYEGEQMYSEMDPCVTCKCGQGWDGDIHGQFCTKAQCDLNLDSDKLLRGCQPVYKQGVCCHIDWVCPLELESVEALVVEAKAAIKQDDKCLLPKEVGPCKMTKDMYYFDVATRKCSLFQYGGCKGNENQFVTMEECQNVCREYMVQPRSNDSKSKCDQPKQAGKCRGFMKKYYFNSNAGKCQEFVYTGCQGNDNRFDSLDECEASCNVVQDVSVKSSNDANICEQPVVIGRCKSRMEKYYYDTASGRCNKFYYSGCGGGVNMFDTVDQCRDTCVPPETMTRALLKQDLFVSSPCDQDKDSGPCRAVKPRWYFNKNNGNCEEFRYGGCRGNDNNFATSEECEKRCVRSSSPKPIDVKVFLGRTDKVTLPERVEPPMLGGGPGVTVSCPGCPSPVSLTPEVKMVAGHGARKLSSVSAVGVSSECDNKVVLKHINDVKRQVVAGTNYIFSLTLETRSGAGCQSRVQRKCSDIYIHKPLACRSKDYAECLQLIRTEKIICKEHDDSIILPDMIKQEEAEDEEFDPCFLEKQTGRCRASFNRWYFDAGSRTCLMFKYGGCMGNANNFPDAKSCEQRCGQHMEQVRPRSLRPTPVNPVCQQPMEAGPCYALKPRYFFNFESRRCEKFIYGGCRGNENNFATIEECISSCGKHPRGLAPMVTLPQEERCQFGNNSYALGDILRLPGDQCRTCVCSSPPDMSCFVKKCPLSSFLPPAGGANCVMQQDEHSCCDIGYKCDQVSTPPSTGGSYPLLGGYSGSETIGHEQKLIAGVATKTLLSQVSGVTGDQCDHLTLLDIVEFQRQVVAGTNFRLSLRLRTKSGSDCSEVVEKTCENIVLFRPLPYACTPSKENSHCLSLSNSENINCY